MDDRGHLTKDQRFILCGPYLGPRHIVSAPGTLSIAVALQPGALQSALNINPADIVDRSLDMRSLVASETVEQLFDAIDAASGIHEYVRIFEEYLLTLFGRKNKKSIAEAFLEAHHQLFLPIANISLHFGIGERQLERRVRKVFGVSLRDVRRVIRFGLCLQRMAGQPVRWGDLTQIAQEAGYYDQAHMSREFAELAGLTPNELIKKINTNDHAYWLYRINSQDYQNLFIPAKCRIDTSIAPSQRLFFPGRCSQAGHARGLGYQLPFGIGATHPE